MDKSRLFDLIKAFVKSRTVTNHNFSSSEKKYFHSYVRYIFWVAISYKYQATDGQCLRKLLNAEYTWILSKCNVWNWKCPSRKRREDTYFLNIKIHKDNMAKKSWPFYRVHLTIKKMGQYYKICTHHTSCQHRLPKSLYMGLDHRLISKSMV